MDKIPGIMKIGYQSLRKISKYFEIFLEFEYLIKQSRIGQTKIMKKQSIMKNLNILTAIYIIENF